MKLTSSVFFSLLCIIITTASSLAILLHSRHTRPYLLMAEASNNFTNKFLPTLLDNVQTRNAIYSPLSVYLMLISFYFGSEGDTKDQLKLVADLFDDEDDLRLTTRTLLDRIERDEKIAEVRMVNYIWIENETPINQRLNTTISQNFEVNVDVFNPKMLGESLQKINGKTEAKTNGLVKNIITMDEINMTKTLALSSIFFTGEWAQKFHLSPSAEKTIFHISRTEGTMVYMMHAVGDFNCGTVPGLNAEYIELPFDVFEPWGRKKAITMFIIRPDSFEDLDLVVRKFGEINVSELANELKPRNVFLPQFKVESNIDMKQPMNKVGIQNVFDTRSELNLMSTGNFSTPISVFKQKVFLEINEAGVNIDSDGSVIKAPETNDYLRFEVDVPFIAVILDNETKAQLLVARIIDPNEWLSQN